MRRGTFISFLLFCTKVIRLGWIFIRSLWDLVAKFSFGLLGFCERIYWQVYDNLTWWNNLLPKFNKAQFFINKRLETFLLYKDVYSVGLGSFYFKHPSASSSDIKIQPNIAFVFKTENCESRYSLYRSKKSMIYSLLPDLNI